MKYRNASSVLPEELLHLIQKYVQGEYLYIPIQNRNGVESVTGYKRELEKRNARIYTKHLEGVRNQCLAQTYHLSESSIRRIIIEQRKRYASMKDKIYKILFHWGLQNEEVKQIYDTAWQVEERYVLKVYQNLEMLERNLKILHILDDMNIPVGKTVPTQDGRQYVSWNDHYYFLSEKLAGSSIVRLDDVGNIALKMGEIIADLHIAFQKCENADDFWNNSLLEEMNGWVKSNLESDNWKYVKKEEYEELISQLANIYDRLPVQLIHRDVHLGNFLFADGEFSGYIDFDLSQRNIRIFDLCYFLLGLWSEEEKMEITEKLWFEFMRDVINGYERKLKLSETEKRAIPYVMECIELLFVAYFDHMDDVCCAEDAFNIFEWVKKREKKIWKSLCVKSM